MIQRLLKNKKAIAIVCAAVFAVSFAVTLYIYPRFLEKEREYNSSNLYEKSLEKQLHEINMQYYAEVLESGLFPATDEDGNEIGFKYIYSKLDPHYKYRIYVNKTLLQTDKTDSIEVSLSDISIEIEEYYEESSTYVFPDAILKNFSFLRTRGEDYKKPAAISDIVKVLKPDNITVESKIIFANFGNRILIECKNIQIGNEIYLEFDRKLGTKLELMLPSIRIGRPR